MIETPSRLVNKVIEVGLLEDFLITNYQSQSMLISHLLFVDDTIFFCKHKESI